MICFARGNSSICVRDGLFFICFHFSAGWGVRNRRIEWTLLQIRAGDLICVSWGASIYWYSIVTALKLNLENRPQKCGLSMALWICAIICVWSCFDPLKINLNMFLSIFTYQWSFYFTCWCLSQCVKFVIFNKLVNLYLMLLRLWLDQEK